MVGALRSPFLNRSLSVTLSQTHPVAESKTDGAEIDVFLSKETVKAEKETVQAVVRDLDQTMEKRGGGGWQFAASPVSVREEQKEDVLRFSRGSLRSSVGGHGRNDVGEAMVEVEEATGGSVDSVEDSKDSVEGPELRQVTEIDEGHQDHRQSLWYGNAGRGPLKQGERREGRAEEGTDARLWSAIRPELNRLQEWIETRYRDKQVLLTCRVTCAVAERGLEDFPQSLTSNVRAVHSVW